MKKILLPTDFSDNSWNAIKYGLQLYKNETCTFYLLNTYSPVIYHVEYVLIDPAQFGLYDAARETSLEQLETLKKRIIRTCKNPKHTFEIVSRFNTLIPEIKETVTEKQIDLIIMGTKGATAAKEVLFGTNTVHTIKNVKCPVLAIPENFEFEIPLEILFPTDYEIEYKPEHVSPFLNIAQAHHSRVHVLNASYGYDLSEAQERNRLTLDAYFKKIAHLFHSVSNQKVTEAIQNFQLKTRINLLVMINNKHSFFEKLFFKPVINEIGFHLNIPFLVIPSVIENVAEA